MILLNKLKEENFMIQINNQNQLRDLEAEYINDQISRLPEYIETQKQEITNKLIEYQNNHRKAIYDKSGNLIGEKIILNPLVISNYFFKSVTPISSQIPEYNAEKLGIVYDYYLYLITEINDKIGNFPSSLTSFCKLAGITLSTLRNYRNSNDIHMRNIVEKIYDQVNDENVTMSQMGVVKERSTMFKMRSQNEVTEKVAPNVNVNYTEIVDTAAVLDRINKHRAFVEKKNQGK